MPRASTRFTTPRSYAVASKSMRSYGRYPGVPVTHRVSMSASTCSVVTPNWAARSSTGTFWWESR